jgi:hypothetical protein
VTTAGPEVARISIRRQQFVIGRPIELDEASPRISAVEYAVGAVAGEVVNGLRVFASRHRIDLDRVEAVATGELQHGLTYLEVVGEGGQPRIARVRLKVFVATADEPGVRRLWDALISKLPFRTRGQLLSASGPGATASASAPDARSKFVWPVRRRRERLCSKANPWRSSSRGVPTGRDPWSPAKIIPGVQVATYDVGGNQAMQQSALRVHGARDEDEKFAIDGTTVNWPGGGGGSRRIAKS